jgi:hypothetical protein
MTDLQDFSTPEPPAGLTPPQQALWWLRKGGFVVGDAWDRAHERCQSAEGTRAYDHVHALAHRIEGDDSNADYWYRRAGAERVGPDVAAEWEHMANTVV